ncbi:MAG: hypothetical protein IJ446_05715, partial [Oscillospiraceae bacterium]|nr:hypothetical protein [Oscillospiraceae bacterium]
MKELIRVRINKYIALLTAFAMFVCIFVWYVPPIRIYADLVDFSNTYSGNIEISGTWYSCGAASNLSASGWDVISQGQIIKANSTITNKINPVQNIVINKDGSDYAWCSTEGAVYTFTEDVQYSHVSISDSRWGSTLTFYVRSIGEDHYTIFYPASEGGSISVTHVSTGTPIATGERIYINTDDSTNSFKVTGTPVSGYRFVGVKDSTDIYVRDITDGTQDGYVTVTGQSGVTFTPIFEKEYTISYKYGTSHEVKGGTDMTESNNPAVIIESELGTTLADPPDEEGWDFLGWSTDSSGGVNISSFENIDRSSNSEVLYSVWEKIKSSECDIKSVKVHYYTSAEDMDGVDCPSDSVEIIDTNISVTLPFGIDKTAVDFTFELPNGASYKDCNFDYIEQTENIIDTQGDFSGTDSKTITIVAEDGTTKTYNITVQIEELKEYTVNYYYKAESILSTKNVTDVTAPYLLEYPAPRSAEKFVGWYDTESGVLYDGYTAVTQIDPSTLTSTTVDLYSKWETAETGADIESFTLDGVKAIINDNVITVTCKEGTDLTNVTPVIVLATGSEKADYGTLPTDYSTEQTITVTSEDKMTTADYTVKASAGSSSTLTGFSYNGTEGTISGNTITLVLPEGTDLTAINASECTIETAEGTTYTFTGTLASPSALVLTSSDGISTKTYTVTAKAGSSSELISFSYNGTAGTISGETVTITLPEGTDLTAINASECTLVVAEGTTYTFTGTLAAPSNIIVKSSDGI